MASPDFNPQFRVLVERPDEIYGQLIWQRNALIERMRNIIAGEDSFVAQSHEQRIAGISQKHKFGDFELGSVRIKESLFSKLTTSIFNSHLRGEYTPEVCAYYRNPNLNGYWSSSETEQLRIFLSDTFASSPPKHLVNNRFHLLTLDDSQEQARYLISLGYESRQQQDEVIREANRNRLILEENWVPEDEDEHFILRAMRTLVPNRFPRLVIGQYHISADFALDSQDENDFLPHMPRLKLGSQEDFVRQMHKFTRLTEGVINAIASIKGNPQRGILVIQPDPNPDQP